MTAKEKFNLMDVIPYRSERVMTEWEDDRIVISFPRFRHAWMARLLFSKETSLHARVELEEHGTAVWQQIDNRRTVREIIEILAEHFHYEPDYESRVTAYLYRLQKDKLITFLIRS